MADLSTSGGFAKKLRENTSKWDASGECIAPLTQNQRDTVLELTSMTSKRSMPTQVSKTSLSNSELSEIFIQFIESIYFIPTNS